MKILEALTAAFLLIGLTGMILCGLDWIVKAKVWKRRNKAQALEHYPARWKIS